MSEMERVIELLETVSQHLHALVRNAETPDRLSYTPREVAEMTGIPYEAVLALINRGELAARKFEGVRSYVIPRGAVLELLGRPQLRSTA